MNRMWQSRTPRERLLIVLAACVVVGGGMFEFVIDPVLRGRSAMSQSLPRLRAESLELARQLDAARSAREALSAGKMPLTESNLRESLSAAQLSVTGVQLAAGGAGISLRTPQPEAVLRWAADAASVFGVSIRQFEVTWGKDAAEVRLQLAP